MKTTIFVIIVSISITACAASTTLVSGARVVLSALVKEAVVWLEDNIIQERGGIAYVDNYNIGDTMSDEDSKALLAEFRKNGFGDDKCGLYICKDTEIPCNPKESDCDCKCEIILQ